MKTTKKAKVAFLKSKLATDDAWALRGLRTVFRQQTEHEKAVGKTEEDNGVGFSGLDAEFLTSLATQFEKRGFLTPKQMTHVHRKMPKYAAQLLRFSDDAKLEKAMVGQPSLPAMPKKLRLDDVLDWEAKEHVESRQSSYYDHSTYRVPLKGEHEQQTVVNLLHAAYKPQFNKFGGYTSVGSVTFDGAFVLVELIYHIGD